MVSCLHFYRYWAILGNMCIAIVPFPSYDIMNFEIYLFFLIKPFFVKFLNCCCFLF